MILTNREIDLLKKNWCDPSRPFGCKAIVRFYSDECCIEIYLIAIDPDREDLLECLTVDINNDISIDIHLTLTELATLPLRRDDYFVPREVIEIYKRLNNGN